MPNVTKRGVYLDLNESPYTFNHYGTIYRFSSKFRLSKFIKDVNLGYAKLGAKIESLKNLTGLALSGVELDRQLKGMYDKVYQEVEPNAKV